MTRRITAAGAVCEPSRAETTFAGCVAFTTSQQKTSKAKLSENDAIEASRTNNCCSPSGLHRLLRAKRRQHAAAAVEVTITVHADYCESRWQYEKAQTSVRTCRRNDRFIGACNNTKFCYHGTGKVTDSHAPFAYGAVRWVNGEASVHATNSETETYGS
jgi:hypothetical protein